MSASEPSPLSTLPPTSHSQYDSDDPAGSSSAPGQTPNYGLSSGSSDSFSLLNTAQAMSVHTVAATTSTISRHLGENGIVTAQEVHIVKVAGDTVQLEQTSNTLFQNFTKSFIQVQSTTSRDDVSPSNIGPPPPSPPLSIDRDEREEDPARQMIPRMYSSKSDMGPQLSKSDSTMCERPLREVSFLTPRAGPSSEADQSATPDNVAGSSVSRPSKLILNSPNASTSKHKLDASEPSSSRQYRQSSLSSVDSYPHPPPKPRHPARRNTTGSTPKAVKTVPMHRHDYVYSQPQAYEDGEVQDELANDIQLHAEQIRRERASKRVKAQQEAEAALTLVESTSRSQQEPEVLVGNLIGEDHVNYILMYNMLTGIRIGVSRCQAKMKRLLTDEDFTARHKYTFDIVGNELTPSAKYDFKFKDYAPWVFRELREDYFRLDPADYLLSLTAQYILSELGSPGKSGSFFYFSRDYRFIIKTIRRSEHKFLRSILKEYYEHVKNNPHTLLSRFYGLHRVKLPRGRKIHFVIMNNLFPPHRDIHETYDLKGSTVGRNYPEEQLAANPRATMKDLNWIRHNKMLELGPEKRALLTEQLRRDAEFLSHIHVMDYSLLVGIHNMRRGNRDNVRKNTLKVFSPDITPMRRKPTHVKDGTSPEAIAMRRVMRESDPKRLGKGTIRLPESDTGDRQHFLFYQDESGLRATDEANEAMDTIYYLGIIDILTPYGVVKRLEHFWKGLKSDRHKISPVPPVEYADRFFSFMKAIMRGGGGAGRFKAE